MIIKKMDEMKGGWFVGDFEPTLYKTTEFEVAYHTHKKGSKHATHYHKESDEINYLIRGRLTIGGVEVNAGEFFILERMEISESEFLEDCEIVVVKTKSVKGDKYTL
jgi:quercetin dioxygenase-like cupin family protein